MSIDNFKMTNAETPETPLQQFEKDIVIPTMKAIREESNPGRSKSFCMQMVGTYHHTKLFLMPPLISLSFSIYLSIYLSTC